MQRTDTPEVIHPDKPLHPVVAVLHRFKHINITLLDQAVVSGVNFISNILLARLLGLSEFGLFALGWYILQLIGSIQTGLILYPMMSIGPKQPQSQHAGYFGALLVKQAAFSVVLLLLTWGIAQGSKLLVPQLHLYSIALPLAVAIFAFQMQDFIRRYFFTLGRVEDALVNDLISYGGQLILFITLFYSLPWNAGTALWIVAATSGLAFGIGFLRMGAIRFETANFGKYLKMHWQSGSWLTLSNLVLWAGSQGIFMVAGIILGTTPLGGVRAVNNLTACINIFSQGLQNYLPLQASTRLYHQGHPMMTRYLLRFTLLVTLIYGIIALLGVVFSEPLMQLLYGRDYIEYAPLILWQGVYILLAAPLLTLGIYFRTIENTKILGIAYAISAPISLLASVWLLNTYHVAGYFMGAVFNQVLVFIFSLICFFKIHASISGQHQSPQPETPEQPMQTP